MQQTLSSDVVKLRPYTLVYPFSVNKTIDAASYETVLTVPVAAYCPRLIFRERAKHQRMLIHAILSCAPPFAVDICITSEVVAQSVPDMSGSEICDFDSWVELVNELPHPLTGAHNPLRPRLRSLYGTGP